MIIHLFVAVFACIAVKFMPCVIAVQTVVKVLF